MRFGDPEVAAQLLQLGAPPSAATAVAEAAPAVEAATVAPHACDGACEICGQRRGI